MDQSYNFCSLKYIQDHIAHLSKYSEYHFSNLKSVRDRQLKKLEENGSLDVAASLEKLDRQNVSRIGSTAKLSLCPVRDDTQNVE